MPQDIGTGSDGCALVRKVVEPIVEQLGCKYRTIFERAPQDDDEFGEASSCFSFLSSNCAHAIAA